MNPIYDLLRADGSIVINKNLIFAIGLHESIIYAELVSRFNYFSDRENLTGDGYFYNTISDLQSGTGLGEKAQRTAIKSLESLGLIDIDRRGMPPKRHFTILDNEPLLKDLLVKGKIKQAETLATAQLRLMGGIKGTKVAETKTLYGRANNTKSNNPKVIKDIYISLPTDGYNSFFKIYGEFFYRKFKKKHMKLSEPNMTIATGAVDELIEAGVDVEEFTDGVREHFNTLAKTNNGNILAFLKASRRNFDRQISYY